MTLEEAIKTALDYENRIRDLYRECAEQTKDPTGKKIFRALADDEQRHVDYLNHKLEEWRTSGTVTPEHLASAIPPKQVIEKEAARLRVRMATDDRGLKQQMLSKALKLEIETSDFYRQMVAQLPAEGQNCVRPLSRDREQPYRRRAVRARLLWPFRILVRLRGVRHGSGLIKYFSETVIDFRSINHQRSKNVDRPMEA